MRAYEFITEERTDGLTMVDYSLPITYVLPELKNNDFYQVYRFGLAIADVRGNSGDDNVQNQHKNEFKPESTWGESMIISSFDPNIESILDQALGKVHKTKKIQVSKPGSDEIPSTGKSSPLKPFKGYKK